MKLCECGCGKPTARITRNHTKSGAVKGEYRRFIRGHSIRGALAPWWRGDDASYGAIHTWLRKRFPKSGVCDECRREVVTTDYALIHGREYSRDRADYRELCRKCHVAYDGIGGSRWRGVVTARSRAGDDAPSCLCGCGQAVTWDYPHARWHRFAAGHYVGAARRLAAKEVV